MLMSILNKISIDVWSIRPGKQKRSGLIVENKCRIY